MAATVDPEEVRSRLADVVSAMKAAGIWDTARPPDEAFTDMGAFGMHTMAFEQWLRWVFVPSGEQRLADGGPWPDHSQVAVQATREGDTSEPVAQLAPALRAFDAIFELAESDPAERAEAVLDESPAADPGSLDGLVVTLRALVEALMARPEHAALRFFGAAGEPVPEGDVPFGWVGTVAHGRAHIHALVSDLRIFAPVEVQLRGPSGLVFRSIQVHGAGVREAVDAISAWIRSEAPLAPSSLTPLDAAVVAHAALFGALPGWRLGVTGGADYYAPGRPALASVVQRRFPGALGVTFEARAEGGVLARGMPTAMRGNEPEWILPTYEALLVELPEIVRSSACAIETFVAFRARPWPIGAATSMCVNALREAKLARGRWEAVVDDGYYPSSWPNARIRLHEGLVVRHVATLDESEEGCRVAVGEGAFTVAHPDALQAAMPAIVEQARAQLSRFTAESLVEGRRYRVVGALLGFGEGETVRLVAVEHFPHDGGDRYELESVDRPGARGWLGSASADHEKILAEIDRYLAPV